MREGDTHIPVSGNRHFGKLAEIYKIRSIDQHGHTKAINATFLLCGVIGHHHPNGGKLMGKSLVLIEKLLQIPICRSKQTVKAGVRIITAKSGGVPWRK